MTQNAKSQGGATFILGVLLWALAVNFLRGGPTQAKGWAKAKLFNEPMVKGISK